MKGKKRHEEHIMNIATDRCDPSLSPGFERIHVPRKGDVYAIEVQERQGPYHAVRTPKGYRFFVRVGSTIREKKPSELVSGEQGVEISAESGLEKFWSWFGKKMLYRLYGKLNVNLLKLRIGLGILALLLIIVPILMIFRFGNVIIVISDYPVWTYTVMFVSLVTGLVLIDFLSYMPRTTCPMCDSQFSFRTRKKWVFEKRTIKEGLEDWKTRTLKQCDECGHEELGKLVYEEVSV